MEKFTKSFNYDDVFVRSLAVGFTSEFYRKVRWSNTWSNTSSLVTVPVYYGLSTDERFSMDLFIDEIVGKRPDLNIDPIPRAHFTWSNSTIKRNEYSNPNVEVEYYKYDTEGNLKKLKGIIRFLPIKSTFSLEIKLNKEIDLMKCQESLWEFFFAYKYFYVKFKDFRIDCILDVPDDKALENIREIDGIKGKNDTIRSLKFDFDIHSYFPIEPIETPPVIDTSCNSVIFKGTTNKLTIVPKKRNFLGGDVNPC